MHLINETNCFDAWHATSRYILDQGGETYNILINIEDPCLFDQSWLDDYNPKNITLSKGKKGDNLTDVIHTIFPMRFLSRFNDRQKLYAYYLKTHLRKPKISGRKNNRWGTYFTRLICYESNTKIRSEINPRDSLDVIKNKHEKIFSDKNQLEIVISKLANWEKAHKAALYCHISSTHLDSVQTIGSPCLQYLQFSQPDVNHVDMTAVYRNHDYFNKALGNFIGLGQLLKFICDESGKIPGRLTCHSIHAYIDVSNRKMRQLLRI